MRVEYVRADAGLYKVHIDGDDLSKPFAVFFHGGPGFHCHGERSLFAGRFRSEVNFLWFDLLGCGDFRPTSDAAYTWSGQVGDAAAIIRHFTREPAHLVGHCCGIEVIHDLVRLDRAVARSVIWYSPLRSLAGALQRMVRRSLSEERLDPRKLTAEERVDVERFLTSPDDARGARDAAIMLRIAEASRDFFEMYWIDRTAMARWAAWMAEQPFSVKAYLDLTAQLYERGPLPTPDYAGIPVHMLYSDADPVTPWEEHGQWLLQQIPHATTAVIPGGGHWVQFERPDDCIRHTLELFARN